MFGVIFVTIGQRLREERERLGYTQPSFAELAGTTKKSQIDYEKDLTQPKAGYLAYIAAAGADIQYIVTGVKSVLLNRGPVCYQHNEYGVIPVYDVEVSAGNGQIAYDETPLCHFAYRKDWLNERELHEGDLRVVCARGDSMEPTIGDKDYLLVNTAEKEPKDGHIYVIRSCDMLWVKRIQRLLDGSLLLISDNKIYPPMPLKLDEASDIEIIGKVVNSSKNFY